MNEETLKKIKLKLEKEKEFLEGALKSFAEKDKKMLGDWDTLFPGFNGATGGAALEQAADEVEEYSTLLPIEHNLEIRLKDVNSALEKIKKGKYGTCEKCKKLISIKRLKVFPEAKYCQRCFKKTVA